MNIFVLDKDPIDAAQAHCDKHVVKMVLESTQILSTLHHLYGDVGKLAIEPYRKTHESHPCVKWAGETSENFNFLVELTEALFDEYSYRYDKTHASEKVFNIVRVRPHGIPTGDLTQFALAMPEIYKTIDPVESYRAYYRGEKRDFAKWTHRAEPYWWY